MSDDWITRRVVKENPNIADVQRFMEMTEKKVGNDKKESETMFWEPRSQTFNFQLDFGYFVQ